MESFNEFSSRNKYIDETSSVNETIQSNKLTSFKDFQAKQKLEQDKINQYNAASLESYRNSMTQPAQAQNEGTAAANVIASQPTQKLGFGATVGNVLKSAAKSTASSLGNLQGTLFATGQNNRDAMNNEIAQSYQRQASTQQLELDEMLAENRLKPGTYTDEQIALQQDKVNKSNEIANNLGKVNDYQRKAVEANNQFVDELSASAQQDVESAKAGRNAVGRTLVDVGVAGTQLLGDAATNLILPGASLAVMGARSAGGAMQKARQEGASLAKQLGYGAAIGATSILAEKLFDGLAGAFGAGAADDMVEGWVKSIATKWGKGAGDVADIVFGFLGEASEEAIEDVADRIIDKVSKVGVDDKLTLQEVMYDALIGGILGSLGTTTKVVRQNIGANAQRSAQVDVNQENTSLSGEMSQNVENEQEVKPQAETINQPQATKSYTIEEVNLANGQKGYTVKYTVNDGTNTLYPTGKTYRSKNAAQNYINSISEEITEQDVNIEQKVDETQNPGYNANVNVMKGATDNGGTDLQAEVGREVSEGRTSAETDTGIVGERPLVQRNLRNDGVILLNEQQLEPIKAKGGTPIVMPTTSNDSAYENYLKIAKESDKQNGWAVTQKSAEELYHCTKLMDANGNVGAAVAEDGDIVAVFKRKGSGIDRASNSIMPQAIAAGGVKLDCYGDVLVNNYSLSGGMKPVCRVEFNEEYANEGWDESKGKPYIYFMIATDTDPNTIIQKQGTYPTYTKEELEKLPTFGKDGYEDAMNYRDSLLKGEDSTAQLTSTARESEIDRITREIDEEESKIKELRKKYKSPILKNDPNATYSIVKYDAKGNRYDSGGGYDYTDLEGLLKSGYRFDSRMPAYQELQGFDVDERVGFFVKSGTKQYYVITRETETPNSVGGAHINSKDFSDFAKLENKYDVIDNKPNAVRLDDVPRQTKDNNKVSETASTVKGAKVTPDDFVPLLEKDIVKDGFSFIPITNDATTKKATARIERRGWVDALKEWTADVRSGKNSAELTAEGALLYNNAVNKGDYQGALDILSDYQMNVRSAAQSLQASRILKTLTPESRLYMIQKSIDGIIEDMRLPDTFTISEELKNKYKNAKTETERDAAINEIIDEVAEQLPVTGMDKLNAIRYMNMLGNFKTQIRNVLGNVAMQSINDAKNAVATGLEAIVSKVNPKYERTRAVKIGKGLLDAANADFVNVKKKAMGEKKYSIIEGKSNYNDLLADAMERRTIFKNKALEGYRKATNIAMEKGDVVFSQRAYARSLAGYLKAHKVTAEQWNDSGWKVSNKNFVDKARAFAIKDAQESTFRDTNKVSGWLATAARSNSTPKFVKTLMEGLMPFRKTPANIMVRAEEYSPIGFANALVMATKKAKGNVEITGTDIVNQLAKSTTGTVIFLAGMLLRAAGILRGGDKEDENQQYFDEMQGHQSYALEIGNTSYTMDWLSPGAIPLFMGVAMYDAVQDDGLSLGDFGDVFKQISDPMLQMSMLQSVNDTLDTLKYSDENLPNLMEQLALSYLTQAMTNTLVGQAERTFEDVRMSTYVDKNKDLSSIFQKSLGKASAKTPGVDYNQYPYINPWGEEESTGGIGERIFTNFISPGYLSKITNSATEKELQRIVEKTGDSNLYPSLAEKSFTVTTYDDKGNVVSSETKKLTMDEYSKYAKEKGQQSAKILEKLFASNTYKALNDEQKADAVKKAYEYATADAKSKVSDYVVGNSNWVKNAKESNYEISEYIALYEKYGESKYLVGEGYEKMKKAEKVGLNNEDYIKLKESIDLDKNKSVTQEEAKWYLDNKTNLTNSQKDELWSIINSSWKNSPYSTSSKKTTTKTSTSAADFWLKKLK